MPGPEHKEVTYKYLGRCGVCSYTFEVEDQSEAESLCSAHLANNRNPDLGKNEKLHFCNYSKVESNN